MLQLAFLLSACVSFSLTLDQNPIPMAPYILYISLSSLFALASQPSSTKPPLTLNKAFWVVTMLFSGICIVIVAPTLPLKGPSIPLLTTYIGITMAIPLYLSHKIKARLLSSSALSSSPSPSPYSLHLLQLIVPIFTTATTYIHALIFPYGSYGILPYVQYTNLPLVQIASVFGVWGIEFVVAWTASGLHLSLFPSEIPSSAKNDKIKSGGLKLTILIFVIINFVGSLRLKLLSPEGNTNAINNPTVRIAGVYPINAMIVRDELLRHHLGVIMDGIEGPGAKPEDFESQRWQDIAKMVEDDYEYVIERIRVEARAGARIVMTPELSLLTFEGPGVTNSAISTEALVKRLEVVAKEENIWIGIGLGINRPFVKVPDLSQFNHIVLEKGVEGMMGGESNRFILIAPDSTLSTSHTSPGNLQPSSTPPVGDVYQNYLNSNPLVPLNYIKYNPVPVIESPFGQSGDKDIPTGSFDFLGNGKKIDTGAAVCFDMEHAWHIQQLGLKSDVILNPSYDWPGLNPYHARIAAFRAVETGNNVFHHCLAGTSLAVDFLGNILASSDYFSSSGDPATSCVPLKSKHKCTPKSVISNLPTIGVKTIYGYIGDSLAHFCVVLSGIMVGVLVLLSGTGEKKGGKEKKI